MPINSRSLHVAIAGAVLVGTVGIATNAEAAPAQSTAVSNFVRRVAPQASAVQRQTGVPASVTIAQAVLESGSGTSKLATSANNLFGLKCSRTPSPSQSGCVTFLTNEYIRGSKIRIAQRFRSYRTAQASMEDYARILTASYPKAMAQKASPDAFAREIAKGFATTPDYANRIISVMRQYNLYAYNTPVRLNLSLVTSVIPAAARNWVVDRNAPPDRVRLLQAALTSKGFRVPVNGRWDAATKRALMAFQRAHGIRADGVAGPKTWQRL